MREIKFRAWDRKAKQFDTCRNGGDNLGFGLDYKGIHNLSNEPFKVYQQFTGLKDKNGKEIYEGDILKLVYSLDMGQWTKYGETTIQVKWSDFQCGFYPFVNFKDIERTEVIGNIYENPELLKGKGK